MRGFTLPEVITVTLVAVIIGGLVLGIMVQNTRLFVQESEKVTQGLGLNDALIKIKSSIKEASSVASSYPQASPEFITGASEIVLKLPSIDSSGSIIDNTFDHIVFTKLSGKLYFKLFPNSLSTRAAVDQLLAKSVEGVDFRYFDISGNEVAATSAVKVRVSVSLKQNVGLNIQTSTATTEANLRND